MIRELAGIFAPGREVPAEQPARALGRDATTIVSGALAVAYTGGQAIQSADRPFCLLDGELSGQAALAAGSPRLGSASVEQLVTHAWQSGRSEIPASLRGSFALLLWDPRSNRGLLARDQMGSRPLFLHRDGDILRFASEVRLLLAMLPTRPVPDGVAVVNWLVRAAAGSGRTMYEGITPLAPGRLIELGDGGAGERRYWDPARLPLRQVTRQQAVHDLRQAIERAVAVRTAGRTSVAAEISGGIDSASVAAFAARIGADGGPSLCGYSAVFPDHPEADESELIQVLTRSLAIPSVRMTVTRGGALGPALRFMQRWQVPLGPGNHFVWEQLLRRAAADGMEVTLNGQGGDELFGAPVYLLADRMAGGRLAAAYRLTRAIPGVGSNPAPDIRRRAMKLWGVRGVLPHRAHRAAWRRRAAARHGPPLLSAQGARLFADSHDPHPWKAGGGPRWRAERAYLLTDGADGMGVGDYLRRRATGAGIESREPLLDLEVVELMLSLPPELSFDPVLSRPLLREAAGQLVPSRVRLRAEKSAFDGVLTDTLRGPDLPVLRELLGRPSPEVGAWVRPGLVRAVLEDPPESHPGGAHAWSKAAWRLASLEMWLRTQDDPSFASAALAHPALREPQCVFLGSSDGVHR